MSFQQFTEPMKGAKMVKSRDGVKERYWRDVLRRQVASELGVRQFCVQEGLPEHRFHWW
ncbi:MAG: hypothetical protein GXX96_23035, partial [Planctomycetaceae bacterium]|nr:hypothetical protein [Planctomycetaceae bacterium]